MIETGTEVVRELDDPNGFWAATTSSRARIMKAPLWFLSQALGEAFRRTPRSVDR
ncbi:MAG: hypothetical protein NTW83_06715 [Cyanobacteria bacterium]|nr:hypothetical protein [Cyanobacteriota bacterium]